MANAYAVEWSVFFKIYQIANRWISTMPSPKCFIRTIDASAISLQIALAMLSCPICGIEWFARLKGVKS
jgi:hypothetical protein